MTLTDHLQPLLDKRFPAARVAAVLMSTAASAQEHLWPAESAWAAASVNDNGAAVAEAVFKEAFQPDVTLRVYTTDAFMRPRADMVFIKHDKSGHRVVTMSTHAPLWMYSSAVWMKDFQAVKLDPPDYHDIRPTRCEAPIPGRLAGRIALVWRSVLLETRYYEKSRVGSDGAWAVFSMTDNHRELIGTTWSPDDDTKPGMLWSIADAMQDYCEKKTSNRLAKLTGDVAALEAKLKP